MITILPFSLVGKSLVTWTVKAQGRLSQAIGQVSFSLPTAEGGHPTEPATLSASA